MSNEPMPISSLRTPETAPAAKLTEWKKEPELTALKLDVEAAKPVQQEQMGKIRFWLDHLNITGSAKLKAVKGRSKVQPQLIRKQAEWRYAPLSEPFLSADKIFTIKPTSWEDKKAAEQNELLLNWQFRTKLNPIVFVDQLVRTLVDEGTVAVQVGWNRLTRMEKVMAPVYQYHQIQDPEQVQALMQASELEMSNPAEFAKLPPPIIESVRYSDETGVPHLAEQIGEEEVDEEKVLKNEPTVEVINTANLLIDATCGADPANAMFMAYSSEVTRGSLRTDGRYKNLDNVNWEGQSILAEPDHVSTGPAEINFADKARQKVVLHQWWGLYDIEGDGYLTPILVAWVGDTMVRCELNPFPDGRPPFVIIPYLPQKRTAYGQPDGALLIDNQSIIGAITRGMIDIMARSANGQRGMAKSMLDLINRRKFDAGEDYEFNPNMHPSQGIVEHKFPEIPASAMNMLGMQNNDAESLTGVKNFGDGLSGNSLGKVAGNAEKVSSAMSQREMGILRRLANGMSQIGSKIVAMNQEFLTKEEVVRVTNEEFITIKRDELHGNFDLEVDISSAEDDNSKAGELSFMLQTVAPNGDPEINKMMLAEVFRLRRMPHLAKQIMTFQPQPDPVAEKLKELQVAEMEAKVQLLHAQAAERTAQAQLDGAKARESSSNADKIDLDYVEQETGTKHARDMDKQGQQAESNQNLAITKGILDQRKPGATNKESSVPDAPDRSAIEQAFGFNQLSKVGL